MNITEQERINRATNFLNLLIQYEGKGYSISRVSSEAGISNNAAIAAEQLKYITRRGKSWTCNIIKAEPFHARKLREQIKDVDKKYRKNFVDESKVIKTKPKYIEQKPKKKTPFNYAKATFIGSLCAAAIATAALCLSLLKSFQQ